MASAQSIVTLMVEREEEVMTPWGGKPKTTEAHFLLPSLNADDATPTVMIPPTDLVGLSSSSRNDLPLELSFEGWRHSTKRWKQWVTQMRPLYQPLWERAGIADAIQSSVCTIVQHKDVILELSERWCSETKSFLFPWGEATITLEDVAMIGGYSLGDECVLKPLHTPALKDIEDSLMMERLEIQRSKVARACQLIWMSKFMDNGSDLEHEAFLCFWLSRFVFPGPAKGTIRKNVLSIAIHLSRGTKIALAPAVLASIYRDLHFLKRREQHSMRCKPSKSMPLRNNITLWAPFQLVQVWIWERFPCLRPLKLRTMSIQISEPRLCRWNQAKTEAIENLSRVFDRSGNTFVWRPYTNTQLGFISEFYGKRHVRVFNTYLHKEALENFVRCIRISEMVGVDVDCIEQYMPHRVGMQFGFSQDIPVSHVEREDGNSEIAWKNYMRPIIDGIIYVPPRYCEHYVSTRYYTCWKRSFMIRLEDSSTMRNGGQIGGMVQPMVSKKRTFSGHLKHQESTSTYGMMIQTSLSLARAHARAPPHDSHSLTPTPTHGCLLAHPRHLAPFLASSSSPSQGFFLTPTPSTSHGCLLSRPHPFTLSSTPTPSRGLLTPRPFTLSLAPTPSHGSLLAPPRPFTLSLAPTLSHGGLLAPPPPFTLSLAPTPSHGGLLAPPRPFTLSLAPTPSHGGLLALPRTPSLAHLRFFPSIPSNSYNVAHPRVFAPAPTLAVSILARAPAPPARASALAPSQLGATLMVIRDPFPSPPGSHLRSSEK